MRPQIFFPQNRSALKNRLIRASKEQHFCKGHKHLSRSSKISFNFPSINKKRVEEVSYPFFYFTYIFPSFPLSIKLIPF